jgi:hypothetical protein
MRTMRRGVLLFVLLCVAGAACARSGVPIVNLERNPIPAGPGGARTLEDVQRAIATGGDRAGHWAVSDRAPGRLKLTLTTRGHVAVVEVTYDTQSYGIRYADSSNLNYTKSGSEELIHPHYNGWVQKLKACIDRELR